MPRILQALPIFGILLSVSVLSAQETVPVQMENGWLRRDWAKCEGNTQLVTQDNTATITSDHSAALFWQIPTREGKALDIDRDRTWIQECDRPPTDFDSEILGKDPDNQKLLNVSDYRYITWKWRVNGTIDDRQTADKDGKILKEGDDFAGKLGISILKKGSDDLREIAYVWTRSIPEESILYQEKRVLFWRYRWHRIVTQSGNQQVGEWVPELRDIYADYKRIYPNEEPGRIVRIYLMSDADNTATQISGAFSNIEFHKNKPGTK